MNSEDFWYVGNISHTYGYWDNKRLNARIEDFVKSMKKSIDFYVKYRGADRERAKVQMAFSKKSEFFIRDILSEHFQFPWVDIDMEVREDDKGWMTDLLYQNVYSFPDVHGKSCDRWLLGYAGTCSWTFDPTKGIQTDEYDEDLAALTYLDNPESATVILKALLPWKEMQKFLREPKKDDLVGYKKCLYLSDLRGHCPKLHS